MPNQVVVKTPQQALEWRSALADRIRQFNQVETAQATCDPVHWLESRFYAQEPLPGLIRLLPHQAGVLRYMFQLAEPDPPHFKFTTMLYSTVKKSGKALALSTAIPTPAGWATMGELREGDLVFDERGRITRIVFATGPMVDRPCYEIEFSDGEIIVADAEHLWPVESLPRYRRQVLSTTEIQQTLMRRDGARNHRIGIAPALMDLPDRYLAVEPYALGAWLGDGKSDAGLIFCDDSDAEIVQHIAAAGTRVERRNQGVRTPAYLLGSHGRSQYHRNRSMAACLRSMDLLGNKRIPEDYLRAAHRQRLALLQGLMDTDGWISADGRACEFTSIRRKLAADVVELARSLGLKPSLRSKMATIAGKDCGDAWLVQFHAPADIPVFRLARKRIRQRVRRARTMRSTNRHIIDVRPVASVPVRCIQVDSPSRLYLAGRSMIPTHNTAIAGGVAQWAAEDEHTWGRRAEIYAAANDYEQAQGRIYQAARSSIEDTPDFEKFWHTGDRVIRNRRTGSFIKPVSGDYKGESGANPVLTLWSELWAYSSENARRLWDEMKPSPARRNSVRFVETYRGFEGESHLLQEIEDQALKGGRQLTAGELHAVTDCGLHAFIECQGPDDLVPVWVNEASRIVCYLDSGVIARRMPWLTRDYYIEQERTERPVSFLRHHLNLWGQSEEHAIPTEWWEQAVDAIPLDPADKSTPLVGALDAGVSHDGFALQIVSRHPDRAKFPHHVVQRLARLWLPPRGGKLDFEPIKQFVRQLCQDHLMVEWTYDPYQLHDAITTLRREGLGYFREFGQGQQRAEADRDLYESVKERTIHLLGDADTRLHAQNANKQEQMDQDSRMRFVKKSPDALIDLLVALSMAASECRRLNLD